MDPDPRIRHRFCAHGCGQGSARDWESGDSCRLLMGCAKCGCRMLTKVGHRKPMLICSDCGQPLSEVEAGERRQRLLSSSLFLVGMAAVASMTFFLTRMREPSLEGSQTTEQQAGSPEEAAE